jgi:hypothetical protein
MKEVAAPMAPGFCPAQEFSLGRVRLTVFWVNYILVVLDYVARKSGGRASRLGPLTLALSPREREQG